MKCRIYPGTLNSEGVISIFQPCITSRSQRHLFFHWRFPSQSQPSVKSNHLFVPSLPSRSSVSLSSFQLGFQTLIEESSPSNLSQPQQSNTSANLYTSPTRSLKLAAGEFILIKNSNILFVFWGPRGLVLDRRLFTLSKVGNDVL